MRELYDEPARAALRRPQTARAPDDARTTSSSSRPTTCRSTCCSARCPTARASARSTSSRARRPRRSSSRWPPRAATTCRATRFLFANRFNVAISRARCLAVLVASPGLLDLVAKSVDEMKLANLFCWAADYAAQQIAPDEAERQRRESQRNGRVAKVDLFQPEGDQCPGRDAGGSSRRSRLRRPARRHREAARSLVLKKVRQSALSSAAQSPPGRGSNRRAKAALRLASCR